MAKFQKSDYKKRYNIYTIMGILGDILFYPIIIISLLCCFVIYTDKQSNKVPTFFGVSLAYVKSGSMIPEFQIGDMILLKQVSANDLRIGTVIGFYNYQDPKDKEDLSEQLHQLQGYDEPLTFVGPSEYDTNTYKEYRHNPREGRASISDLTSKTQPPEIYFHKIVAIYIKDDGALFYQTKGVNTSTNNYIDSNYICENYIIGQYSSTPTFLRDVFKFIASPTGIVILVIIPLCLLALFMLFSIIEQVSKIYIERKVLARNIRYDSDESLEANIGIEMEMPDKVRFYATSPQKEKNGVAEFLWGYKRNTSLERDLQEYDQIMKILPYLETDAKKYWYFFQNSTKSNRQKKLVEVAWQEWTVDQKMQEKFKKQNKQKELLAKIEKVKNEIKKEGK